MPCVPFSTPDGARGFMCTTGRRKRCACGSGRFATLLCDWKDPTKANGTCSAPACLSCRVSVGKDKDLCRDHAKVWATHPANPARA